MSKNKQPSFNRNNSFWGTTFENRLTINDYYNRLVDLALSVFEWENLPDTIDARYLELCLLYDGKCVFFEEPDIGCLALRVSNISQYDVYNNPINFRAYSTGNGFHRNLNNTTGVLIYNNYTRTSSSGFVYEYARKMYELDRTIDVNLSAQKTPMLITCDEKQKLTMKNVFNSYQRNEVAIFGYNDMQNKPISCLKTDAPFLADRLYDQKIKVWNEALTYLGIPNVREEKKERVIVDEVKRSQGGTIANRYSKLNARLDACKKINKMFGLNISCKYREGFIINEQDEVQDYE